MLSTAFRGRLRIPQAVREKSSSATLPPHPNGKGQPRRHPATGILHGQQAGGVADERQGRMNGPVQVATDGACLGNPGPGGWAWTTGLTDASGGQRVTTNQEMELRAILEALRAHPDQVIVILTDSQYAIDCVTTWLPGWRRRGWRTSARRPVKHQPTIEAIAAELDRRTVQLVKVPGHAGHPLNERADRLAAAAAARAALPRQ